MKKILAFVLVISFAFVLVGCAKGEKFKKDIADDNDAESIKKNLFIALLFDGYLVDDDRFAAKRPESCDVDMCRTDCIAVLVLHVMEIHNNLA